MRWFKQLDGILRGDATRVDQLRDGEIKVSIRILAIAVTLLAMAYGLCMGLYATIRTEGVDWMQAIASTVKLPLLFFLTLVVTFPSLYVFNALVGGRLSARSTGRLLFAMLGVVTAVLASFGPIVLFFGISTTSYPFMKLLNVVMCAIAGLLGLAFLLRTMHRLVVVGRDAQQADAASVTPPRDNPSALELVGDSTDRRAKVVFRIWVVVFGLVGAQMSWVLRPFIGDPALPFVWFRGRESNFFENVLRAIEHLLGG